MLSSLLKINADLAQDLLDVVLGILHGIRKPTRLDPRQ
jgi:hypothetical protein